MPAGCNDQRSATISTGLAVVASEQFGLVSRQQCLEIGLGRGAVAHRQRTGSLIRTRPGVFAVGRPAEHPHARFMAVLLELGPAAWVSHRSAAMVWGLLPMADADVDVVVVGGRPRARAGVRLRRTQWLDPQDRSRRGALRVAGVARTIVDLAAELDGGELERLAAEARALHRLAAPDLRAAAARSASRRGRAALRTLLDDADGPRRTRSEAERRFLELLRLARLPRPLTNVRVGPFVVDALWRDERVVVEVDGFAFHGSRRAFEADRRRDAELQARGYVVLRVTWRQIVDEPAATAARIGALLAIRRASSA